MYPSSNVAFGPTPGFTRAARERSVSTQLRRPRPRSGTSAIRVRHEEAALRADGHIRRRRVPDRARDRVEAHIPSASQSWDRGRSWRTRSAGRATNFCSGPKITYAMFPPRQPFSAGVCYVRPRYAVVLAAAPNVLQASMMRSTLNRWVIRNLGRFSGLQAFEQHQRADGGAHAAGCSPWRRAVGRGDRSGPRRWLISGPRRDSRSQLR